MAVRHIGVLTGGGDVPGLNAAIKSVYVAAKDRGWTRNGTNEANVTGILRGWKGAVHMAPDPETGEWGHVLPLTDDAVREVDRFGGTFLHSSRTRPDRMRQKELPDSLRDRAEELPRVTDEHVDATDAVIENLTRLGIDCLIAIGGDDTLGYGRTLSSRGFPVVGIPKTMDNDVRGTEYCLGFATAINRAVTFINRQRTHLGSHETVGVFRMFGRDAGFSALGTAMAISDLRCAIPEQSFELDDLCHVIVRDREENPVHYALVVISEGAIWKGGALGEIGPADAYGHRHKQNVGEALVEEITRRTGLPARTQDLTHDLRSGDPDPLDRMVANTFGTLAVELISQGRTGRMVVIRDGIYMDTELPDPKVGPRTVDPADYDAKRFRPDFTARFGRPLFF